MDCEREINNINSHLQLLTTCIDRSNDVIVITEAEPFEGASRKIVYVNQAFEKVTGYTKAEALGNTPRMLFGEKTDPETRARIAKKLAKGQTVLETVLNYTKTGQPFWAEINISPVLDTAGKIGHWMSVQRDVTQNKAMAAELLLLETCMSRINDVIVISEAEPFDHPGPRILYVNDAFEKMTGYSRAEAIGQTPRILQGEQTDREVTHRIRTKLEKWLPVHETVLNVKKDGTPFWVELMINPVADEKGWFTHWVAVQRDITERIERDAQQLADHKLAIQLQAEKNLAENASREKSAFLSTMSHEIRTPLNAIMGFSQLLALNELSEKARNQLENIVSSSEHLLHVINDILDYSKIESGEMTAHHDPLHLPSLLSATINIMSCLADKKGIALKLLSDPQLPNHVMGDKQRLQQVLVNFLSNAIKFTNIGTVTLQAILRKLDDKQAVIQFNVIDTGIGIADAKCAELFKAFYQLDNSTNRQYGGTGLGLAISKKFVELMGGTVGVESILGQGSTFWCTINFELNPTANNIDCSAGLKNPTNLEEDFVPQVAAETLALLNQSPLTVLLAEDVRLNQIVATELLHAVGVKVEVANNGEIALRMVQEKQYDMVLMDIQMPVMDGIQATIEIRKLPRCAKLPIIAMTANVIEQDKQAYIEAGMNSFIAKPFTLEALCKTLASFVKAKT